MKMEQFNYWKEIELLKQNPLSYLELPRIVYPPAPSELPFPPNAWLNKKNYDIELSKLDELTNINLEAYWKEIVKECCGEKRVITYTEK